MKNFLIRRRSTQLSGFTLVELLVVIAIIAILAATILRVGTLVLNIAKRTKTMNMATQIQTACLSYYTEYSVYPVVNAPTTETLSFIGDTSSSATNWGYLIDALSGNIKPSTGLASNSTAQTACPNTRAIAFLNLKASDVDSNDAPLNSLPTGTGASQEKYFNIVFDSDYSGVIGDAQTGAYTALPNFNASPFNAAAGGGTTTAGVAVWANCNGSLTTTSANWWVHTY